jgi:hypothetical protein
MDYSISGRDQETATPEPIELTEPETKVKK